MDYTDIFSRSVAASRSIQETTAENINATLLCAADRLEEQADSILKANAEDLSRMDPADPLYDRLLLTPDRLHGIADDMRNVAALHSPVWETIDRRTRPNGMTITKVRVPFGVIGVIYEARPNVSCDVFALCFKTANAVILKGGSDAEHSNRAIVEIIRSSLADNDIDPNVVTLLPSEREAAAALLGAVGYVDLVIPRGSKSLIDYVRDNARVPVIETGAGICHAYFDSEGDTSKGAAIVFNAKTRRVSVCNALDTLLVHRRRIADISTLCSRLSEKNVTVYADPEAFAMLEGNYPDGLLHKATPESFGTEFLDYKISVKCVDSIDEAIAHVSQFGSKHSETIITENRQTAAYYSRKVDAACVYTNVSTAFTDGAQFGFGAEIGISTQKLHARGPMALTELTSYKYIIEGDGQTRE